MHDIDRTHLRYAQEMENYPLASEAPALSESQEMQLAADLMEVQTEEEFENFLDDLIGGIAKAAGGFLNSSAGKALGGLLKGAAKKLLPLAGTAIGGYFGGPAGASIGGNIAGTLSGSLEMERDEMEWEAARTFVRLAADAARNAALYPQGETPEDTAHRAVSDSAQKNAPALPAVPPLLRPQPPFCLSPLFLRPHQWRPNVRSAAAATGAVAGFDAATISFCSGYEDMALPAFAAWMLEQEARALRTRLAGVRPFALQESMLPAANLLPSSQIAIEKFLSVGRSKLRRLLDEFLRWLKSAESAHSGAEEAQKQIHAVAASLQFRAHAIRSVRQRHHAAQRESDGRVAVGPRRGLRGRSPLAGDVFRAAAHHLLPRSRNGRRHPARPHPSAGRRRQSRRHHQGAARAHGRQRHRLLSLS